MKFISLLRQCVAGGGLLCVAGGGLQCVAGGGNSDAGGDLREPA